MPTFKTAPEPDATARSPFDDLNRLERGQERNGDHPRPLDEAELRAQERLERVLERNGRDLGAAKAGEAAAKASEPVTAVAVTIPAKPSQSGRKNNDIADPLIQGLFSKLPDPESEWPLAARQKWLQTAANIFDLMYAPNHTDAGELAIRVERNAAR